MSRFWTVVHLLRPSVPSSQVTTTQRRRDRRIKSHHHHHHHQERRKEKSYGTQSFKKNRTSTCSSTIPNSIPDSHHQRHSMVSNHHMLNGQKRCSPSCQSLTIRSLFQSFKQSLVTKTSSQRRFSLREFYQSSSKRSETKIQSSRQVTSGARVVDDQDTEVERIKREIKTLEEKKDSRGLTLMKADNFLRYVLFHSTSGDPNIMVRRIMRTSSSDSEVVTGLEIWRQMARRLKNYQYQY